MSAVGPVVATTNLLETASVVRAGMVANENAAFVATDGSGSLYPTVNAYCGRQSKIWKSPTDTGADWAFDADMGSAKSASFVALHNVREIEEIYLISSTTGLVDSWAIRAVILPASVAGSYYATLNSVTARYWRCLIASSSAAFPQVGELVISPHTQLSRQFIWGTMVSEEWAGATLETRTGNRWTRDYGTSVQRFSLTWRGISESEKNEVRTLLQATRGASLPFSIAPYPNATSENKSAEVYFVHGPAGFSYLDAHVLSKEIAGFELATQPLDVQVS